MRVVINGIDVLVGKIITEIDLNKLTRQFEIHNTEVDQSFFKGDIVEVYTNSGELAVKGEIEYTSCDKKSKFVYAGRNNAKFIVDCHADKTTQFSESQQVQSVFDEVAGKFNLTVSGKAKMPIGGTSVILIGKKYGEAFIEIAKSTGQIITSDAIGNIIIEPESEPGQELFVYGENIRNRMFRHNTTQEYDKYIVISQSNLQLSKDFDVNIQGSYGNGDFVKVIVSESNLNEAECQALAEIEYWKDRRKSLEYTVEVDTDMYVKINMKYMVTDKQIGIAQMMNVKKIIETSGVKTDKLVVTFENRG